MTVARRRGIRCARLAAAALFAVTLTLAGCAQPATIEPYQAGVGADTSAGPVDLRALVIVVNDSGEGLLTGALVSTTDDTLTGISGTALTTELKPADALTIKAPQVKVPAGKLVQLAANPITLSGSQLTPGLYAQLTFTFAQGGSRQIMVPIVSADKADYATPAP